MAYAHSEIDDTNRRWFSNDNTRQSLTKIALTSGNMRGLTPFSLEIRYPILAIAGRNGVGKTTLLALAACAFHAPRDGFQLSARRTPYYTFKDFFVQAEGELGPTGVEIQYSIRHNRWRGVAPGEAMQVRKKASGGKWNNYDSRVHRTVVYFGVQRVVPYFERSAHVSYRGRFKPGSMKLAVRNRIADIAGRIIGKTYDGFESHEHGKYGLPRVATGAQKYSGFNMGAGESAIFEILAAIFAAGEGCLLVIDEIELGLHERAQGRLIAELKKLCAERKCQIICTTHAHAVLAALPPDGRLFVDMIGEQTTLYPGISADYACGQMGREAAQELDIFVEDSVAAAIVRTSLNGELRARCQITAVGSHSSLKRLMAGRYVEDRRNCICFLDGDQRASHEAAKTAISGYCDGEFSKQKEEILKWAEQRLRYLPGDGWPEKWIFDTALQIDQGLHGGWRSSPAVRWGVPDGTLTDLFRRALAAGKHKEFFTLAKELGLPMEQTRADLIAAIREARQPVFDMVARKVRSCLS